MYIVFGQRIYLSRKVAGYEQRFGDKDVNCRIVVYNSEKFEMIQVFNNWTLVK